MERDSSITIRVPEIISFIIYPFLYIGTMSYVSTFAVFSILAVLCFVYRRKHNVNNGSYLRKRMLILSALASMMFMIADYSIFVTDNPLTLVKGMLAFGAGTIVIFNMFYTLDCVLNRNPLRSVTVNEKAKKRGTFAAFMAPFVFDMIYLYACAYPGWVNDDNYSQLRQMINNSYTNHHPFWHTKFLEFIIEPVYRLTGEGNTAVAAVCVIQIIILSLIFMYMVMTLYDIKVKNKWIVFLIVAHTIIPYNAGMSCGLIKDTMFGAVVALMVIAMYRLINNVGSKPILDEILLCVGTILSCLFRTNGKVAVAITVVASWVFLYKYKRKMLILMTVSLIFAVSLNKGYLAAKHIPQPDFVESLSIPLQQIARTSNDKKEIPDKDKEFLDKVVGYDRMGEVYYSIISDSVKDEIRANGDKEYLAQNKAEFFKVWLDIGIRYPFNYLKAWSDQTRGYWGPSYYFSISERTITEYMDPDTFNIHSVEHDNLFNTLFELWEKLILTNIIPSFETIFSVGIRTWLLVFALCYSWIHDKKNRAVAIMPLGIVLTLAIASPMCVEFRYAYSIFTTFPMVMFGCLHNVAKEEELMRIEKMNGTNV